MALAGALEEAFDATLNAADVLDTSSFEEAIEILGKYDVDLSA